MSILISLQHLGVFVKALIRNPNSMGSICPSSYYLAQEMAKHIDNSNAGYVVEIGAGTGSITQALINHGVSAKKLIVVESSEALAAHLHDLFPAITIINNSAAHLREILPPYVTQVHAIVSSLPLRSIPAAEVETILNEFRAILSPQSQLIQYTYDLRSKNIHLMNEFKLIHSEYIWLNLPPACVQVFQKIAI